jgi:hypothetical protein
MGRAVENVWIDNRVAGLVSGFQTLAVLKKLGD